MKDFLAITAFRDTGDRFRRRNLAACIDAVARNFTAADHVVVEQGTGEWYDSRGFAAKHSTMDIPGDFKKSTLLNSAVRDNPGYKFYVMVDADLYMTEKLAASITEKSADGRLLYPFGDAIYMDELDTKRFLEKGTLWPGDKDHGVTIRRQTGLCMSFTANDFERVRGFDEDFTGWGAEDDAFMFKMKRSCVEISRNLDTDAVAFHMFHPKVNTDEYLKGANYRKNRIMCACMRRMNDGDFARYVSGETTMAELVEIYRAKGRLEVNLDWLVVPGTPPLYADKVILHIDTTIYDIDRSGTMSMSKILSEVEKEDGPEGVIDFVDKVLSKITDLPEDIKREVEWWYTGLTAIK